MQSVVVTVVHRRQRVVFFSTVSEDWKVTHQRLLVWYVGLLLRLSYKTTKNSYCSNCKIILPPNIFNNTTVLLFQWGGLMVLLFSINMIYLCCRRSEGEDTVRLLGQKDLETSATEKVISYKDVQLWWSKFYWVVFFFVSTISVDILWKLKEKNSPPLCRNVSLQMPGFCIWILQVFCINNAEFRSHTSIHYVIHVYHSNIFAPDLLGTCTVINPKLTEADQIFHPLIYNFFFTLSCTHWNLSFIKMYNKIRCYIKTTFYM